MTRTALYMIAALVFMIVMSVDVGWAQESSGDQMRKVMESTTPAQRADIQTNLMVEMLSLSEEQAVQVKAVNLKYAKKAAEIFSSQESRIGKFMKMRKMGNDKDKDLQAILSDAQYEAYEKAKKEIRDKTMETREQQ